MDDEAPVKLQVPVIKKKKDEKYRKRDPRSWENIMRATANMSLEEKHHYLENIYNELYNENRTSYVTLQAREKQYTQCLREHEKDRAELAKSILARGQLESLCRELQKQNKLIKEENVARIKEEEDRRREVANTFTERLNALTSLITESKDKSNKVKEENQSMTQKLTELYEQYQQRESHLETVTRQLDLQKKLSETQAKKMEIEFEAERQTLLSQKKALELQLEQYEREIVLLQEKNRSLEAQVDLYKSQYSDFEITMSKSNKVFDTFKAEMSKMSKQLHLLEAERNDVRKRWQSSVNSLITLSEQHVALSNEQSALEKRMKMLQKLCRQLQEERSAFLKQLKENNIEPAVTAVKVEAEEEQEPEPAKEPAIVTKLKQDLCKTKELIKMSDSDSSSSEERRPLPPRSKRPRRVHFMPHPEDSAGSSGDPGHEPTRNPVLVVPDGGAAAPLDHGVPVEGGNADNGGNMQPLIEEDQDTEEGEIIEQCDRQERELPAELRPLIEEVLANVNQQHRYIAPEVSSSDEELEVHEVIDVVNGDISNEEELATGEAVVSSTTPNESSPLEYTPRPSSPEEYLELDEVSGDSSTDEAED